MVEHIKERFDLDFLEETVKRFNVLAFVGRTVEESLAIIADLRRRGFKYITPEEKQISVKGKF